MIVETVASVPVLVKIAAVVGPILAYSTNSLIRNPPRTPPPSGSSDDNNGDKKDDGDKPDDEKEKLIYDIKMEILSIKGNVLRLEAWMIGLKRDLSTAENLLNPVKDCSLDPERQKLAVGDLISGRKAGLLRPESWLSGIKKDLAILEDMVKSIKKK